MKCNISLERQAFIKAEYLAANNCVCLLSSNTFTWQVHSNRLDQLNYETHGHVCKNDMHDIVDYDDFETAKQTTFYRLIQIAIYIHSRALVAEGAIIDFHKDSELGIDADIRWRQLFRIIAPLAAIQWQETAKARNWGLITQLETAHPQVSNDWEARM